MAKAPFQDVELVSRVAGYIEDNAETNPSLDEISQHVNVSPFHMQRIFKKMMGVTPRQYADALRLETFKERLRDGANVADALYDAGYGSSSRVYERAHDHMGMTPAEYRSGGEGMAIHYTFVDTKLGRLIVGMTGSGVCGIHLADPTNPESDEELEDLLISEYPAATFYRDLRMCEWLEEIIALVNGDQPHCKLPLDLRATAFQLRVWDELKRIPRGETRTYGEIAQALGLPGAASAVADAINANPVAFLIPCHRAVRKDGQPTRRYSRRGRVVRELVLEHERASQRAAAGD